MISHLPSKKCKSILLRRYILRIFSNGLEKNLDGNFKLNWIFFFISGFWVFLAALWHSCLSQDACGESRIRNHPLCCFHRALDTGQLLNTQLSENWDLSPGCLYEGGKRGQESMAIDLFLAGRHLSMDISLTGGGEPWAKAAAGMIVHYSAGNGVDLQSTVQKAKVLSQIIREQGTYNNKHTKEDTTPCMCDLPSSTTSISSCQDC